jgi:hypothetical protein
LALGGRLQTPTRPLRSALLAMHHPIGASTGYMDFSRGDWAGMVERAVGVSTFAAELSALGEDELPASSRSGRDAAAAVHYLSVHAPDQAAPPPEPELVALLGRLPAIVDAIVVHPDQVGEPEAWLPLGGAWSWRTWTRARRSASSPSTSRRSSRRCPTPASASTSRTRAPSRRTWASPHRLLDAFGSAAAPAPRLLPAGGRG